MHDSQQPGFLMAIWLTFIAFVASFFRRSSSAAALPTPVTAPPTPRHSPPSPFPILSLSGIFATPRASPPVPQPSPTPSIHTTPSSAVIVDRSPTTMSDGSLEVVSLGGRRGFPGSPVRISDIARLPSPWSPIGKNASQHVWLSANGLLVNATGPVNTHPASPTGSRISAPSLYSSSSALDAFGISVFVNLSGVGDPLPNDVVKPDANKVRDENNSPFAVHGTRTPRKRRETIPSTKKSAPTSRAAKCLSTPLTRIENVDISHLRSASSLSSMAYEFRMGLIADGRSMTAIENIISLLDQDSPEHTQPLNNSMPPVQVV